LRDFSFSKADRIRKRFDFIRIGKTGKKLQNRHFILCYSKGLTEKSRLGITVTKKVGNAAKRNRIKRISREFYRLNRHKINGTWDMNIIAKRESVQTTSIELFQSLENIFSRIANHLETE